MKLLSLIFVFAGSVGPFWIAGLFMHLFGDPHPWWGIPAMMTGIGVWMFCCFQAAFWWDQRKS